MEKKYCYDYPKAAITVDVIIMKGDKILLIKRGNYPFKDMWALPGGFMDMDEELEFAAKRELLEETGIEIENISQFKTYSSVDRDPRHRTISTVFYHITNKDLEAIAGDDAADAKWWNVDDLLPLAFDHKLILEEFINSGLVK